MARARGVRIAADVVERTRASLDGAPPDSTVSIHRDRAADRPSGRPSELFDQTSAIVRLGREASVAVPLHEAFLAALTPGERAARARYRPSREHGGRRQAQWRCSRTVALASGSLRLAPRRAERCQGYSAPSLLPLALAQLGAPFGDRASRLVHGGAQS